MTTVLAPPSPAAVAATAPTASVPRFFLDATAPTTATASASKKRRRCIEPIDDAKILALPLALAAATAATGSNNNTNDDDPVAVDAAFTANYDAGSPTSPAALSTDDSSNSCDEASEILGRSLMGLSLQLKLKMMLMEAWASDMNSVVMERSLFSIAKELAILHELGVYESDTCVRFLELARTRMVQLLAQAERRETMQMEVTHMWTMATIQAHETLFAARPSDASDTSEFPLLPGFDASSRDIAVLWKAMAIAKDRGAQLWHENKPEEALPFLVAADSYMKRFTLKYQRLKIDHAMLDTFQPFVAAPASPKPKRKTTAARVTFADAPEVLGVADANVDRSPITPTKPSKLESLLLRTSREFPMPRF